MKATELTGLRNAIEKQIGFRVKVPADYVKLSDLLNGKVSASTLKRVWGYIEKGANISDTIINILAQFLGHPDYQEFLATTELHSQDQRTLYAAQKIAGLASTVHSSRLERAYKLLQARDYGPALKLFKSEQIQSEITSLGECSMPFVDNIENIVGELVVKALLVWNCHWQDQGVMQRVDEIYNQALPLAESINNHYLLWNIYQDWAFKHLQVGNTNNAVELYEKAYKQGELLYIETGEVDALSASVNDYSMLLCDMEEFQRAKDELERVIEREDLGILDVFLCVNYARACYGLELNELAISKFVESLEIAKKLTETGIDSCEMHHARGIALYNLGVIAEENNEIDTAQGYFTKALKAFGNKQFPNALNRVYYNQCTAKLKNR